MLNSGPGIEREWTAKMWMENIVYSMFRCWKGSVVFGVPITLVLFDA